MFPLKPRFAHLALIVGLSIVCPSTKSLTADLSREKSIQQRPAAKFVASCEHVGQFCHAKTCGADQIDASTSCQKLCPGSVIVGVEARRCPLGLSKLNEHYIPVPDILPDF
ncbi:hypothetical protein [Methylobacterium nigriterrae]|uniref:hypothetical protein n=1 Tax=Methylobacterium nigriterrae TaxID=3127512 RepID=UPI003013AC82